MQQGQILQHKPTSYFTKAQESFTNLHHFFISVDHLFLCIKAWVIPPWKQSIFSINCRIIEKFGLEATLKAHLVQPTAGQCLEIFSLNILQELKSLLSQLSNMVYTTIAWSLAAWQGSGRHSHVQVLGNAVPWKCSFMSYKQLKSSRLASPSSTSVIFSPQVIGHSCPHPELPKTAPVSRVLKHQNLHTW